MTPGDDRRRSSGSRSIGLGAFWLIVTLVAVAFALRSFAPELERGSRLLVDTMGVARFAGYLLYSVAVFFLVGASWWVTTDEPADRLVLFVWGRLVREATADFLPFSQLGGIVFGARAIVVRGVDAALVYASFVADLTTELASQVVFTALGLFVFATCTGVVGAKSLEGPLTAASVALVALTSLAVCAPPALAMAERIARRMLPAGVGAIDRCMVRLRMLYANPARLVASFGLNCVAWTASAFGAVIALRAMQVDVDVVRVLALESLVFLARSTAFAIPAGIGVQEAAYALLGPVFGLPSDAIVGLAVVKRLRDIAIAMPVLLIWQFGEIRRVGFGHRGPRERPSQD